MKVLDRGMKRSESLVLLRVVTGIIFSVKLVFVLLFFLSTCIHEDQSLARSSLRLKTRRDFQSQDD